MDGAWLDALLDADEAEIDRYYHDLGRCGGVAASCPFCLIEDEE